MMTFPHDIIEMNKVMREQKTVTELTGQWT